MKPIHNPYVPSPAPGTGVNTKSKIQNETNSQPLVGIYRRRYRCEY